MAEAAGERRHVVLHAQRLALHSRIELEYEPQRPDGADRLCDAGLLRLLAEDLNTGGQQAVAQPV